MNRRSLPSSGGQRLIHNRRTRFDLRRALHCDLAAVTGRTLSQSTRAAHPFGLLPARSIAGPLGASQSPFPARLQLALGLRLRLRQPDRDRILPSALARKRLHSYTVLISFACRNL